MLGRNPVIILHTHLRAHTPYTYTHTHARERAHAHTLYFNICIFASGCIYHTKMLTVTVVWAQYAN